MEYEEFERLFTCNRLLTLTEGHRDFCAMVVGLNKEPTTNQKIKQMIESNLINKIYIYRLFH